MRARKRKPKVGLNLPRNGYETKEARLTCALMILASAYATEYVLRCQGVPSAEGGDESKCHKALMLIDGEEPPRTHAIEYSGGGSDVSPGTTGYSGGFASDDKIALLSMYLCTDRWPCGSVEGMRVFSHEVEPASRLPHRVRK
jgi:hypothetical protein